MKQKFLDLIPRIDKFMCCLDLKLGVIITSVVLFVLIIMYIIISAIEADTIEYLLLSAFLLIGNVLMLILVIVGVVKENRYLLKSALDWFLISPIFWLVYSIIHALASYWIT